MATPIRLLVDPPKRGTWNMAADEALLESAAETGLPTLRFYRWLEPTLSLGYFQSSESRQQQPASNGCAIVRRSTGGGAILHHHDLTYSLCTPLRDNPFAVSTRSSRSLYDLLHGTFVEVLASYGFSANLVSCENPGDPIPEPFLCFERRAIGDVVLEGRKILGSAQRRKKNALLQHGSVLLATSVFAPRLRGLFDCENPRFNGAELMSRWIDALARRVGVAFEEGAMNPWEIERAGEVEKSQFANSLWLERR